MALGMCQDEFLQNLAFGPKPITQRDALATAPGAPKCVRAFLDLLLHPNVVIHRENGRPIHPESRSLCHVVSPGLGPVRSLGSL
jgi:hypothetical protein